VAAASLHSGERWWLPAGCAYYGYDGPQRLALQTDSNGCALGRTPEEAACRALLELIERDAVAMWWYPRARRPRIDLDACGDERIAALRAWLREEADRDVWALELTNDLGVPTVAALSARRSLHEPTGSQICFGFGAAPTHHAALSGALAEMVQAIPSLPLPWCENRFLYREPVALRWWQTVRVESAPYLVPSGEATRSPARSLPPPPEAGAPNGDGWKELRLALLAALAEAGLEALLLPQHQEAAPAHVVRVVVPGMRIFWPRFAPGRLYDVPPRLGWLAHAPPEAELNPWPIFL
jgi:ribosomal protein S12 methylthiotransferase accessory factor